MKKLLSLFLSVALMLGFCTSCKNDGDIVEKFDKPTDVVNPNPPVVYKYSLKELTQKLGLMFGVATTRDTYYNNEEEGEIIASEFSTVTFGNEMKHASIVSATGAFSFTKADEMYGWLDSSDVQIFGHNLGWHQQQQAAYMNSLIEKASLDNSESLLQDNWNFEEGTLAPFTGDLSISDTPEMTFAGDYAVYSGDQGGTLTTPVVAVENGKPYILSFWACALKDAVNIDVAASDGQKASVTIDSNWKHYFVTLKVKDATEYAYNLTVGAGICIDNFRVVETEEEEPEDPSGKDYINPYTVVEDGGFEELATGDGSVLAGVGWQVNGSQYVSVTEETHNGGKQCVKMDNSAGTAANAWDIQIVSPAFAIEPGKTYRIGWYGMADADDVDMQIDYRLSGSGTQYASSQYSQFDKLQSGKFTYIHYDFTAGESDTEVQVGFYGGGSVNVFWIDDYQIFEADKEGDYTNYIDKNSVVENGDFENLERGDGSVLQGAGWQVNGASYVSVTADAHSALNAVCMDNSEGTASNAWDIQLVSPKYAIDDTYANGYRIAWWGKADADDVDMQIDIRLASGTQYKSSAWGNYDKMQSTWGYYYYDVMPSAGDVEIQVAFYGGGSVNKITIDDYQIFPIPVESYLDKNTVVENGDFENFTEGESQQLTDAGWQVNGASYVSVSSDAHSGKAALKMDNSEGTASNAWDIQLVSPNYPIEPGGTYRLAWYGKADADDVDMQIDIRLGSGTQYKSSAWGQYDKMQSDWTYQYIDFTAGDTDAEVAVGFYGGGSQNVILLDDYQIFPVEPASSVAAKAAMGYGKISFNSGYFRPEPAAKVTLRAGTVESNNKLAGELVYDCLDYAYKNYVYVMVEHFDVYAWDVMNECLTDGGSFRTSENTSDEGDQIFYWGDYFGGKEFVDKAFHYAASALSLLNKTADLYINDYNLESSTAKLDAICEYAAGNDEVDGIGTQMHISLSTDKEAITNMFKKMAATGKKVRVSELDINAGSNNDSSLEAQAELYAFIVDQYMTIVPEAQWGGITVWGISDKDTWLGSGTYPLLFDDNYDVKPAYEALYRYFCGKNGIDPTEE